MNDQTTDGGQDKHLEPFVAHPACPKCMNTDMNLRLWGVGVEEYLEMICNKCRYSWYMETADAGKKPEVILEKKETEGHSALELLQKNQAALSEGMAMIDEEKEDKE